MTGFFRSLFGSKKSISKIKTQMQSRRLELIGLEERITPVNTGVRVDFTTNTGVLSLTSIAADFSVVANANGTLTVSVNSPSVVDNNNSPTVTVTRIGTTNDYTVSVNSGAANVKQLSLIENDSIDNNFVISSIDSTAFNTDFALNIDTGIGTGDTLTINGAVALKGTGALTTAGIETLTIAAAGDITAVNGDVSLVASSINTAGDVVTTAGNIIIGDANLSGNVAINSTSGNLTMGTVSSNASNLTINEGTGTVTVNDLSIGTGNLTITTTNATVSSKASAISLAAVIASGDVRLTSTGDVSVFGAVTAASVNAKSTAGDVIFADTVTTTQIGGFTSEATFSTKSTKIANAVTVGAGANALVTGNLISNSANSSSIATLGLGNITITGNVDASVAGNSLYLDTGTGTGIITISGNVGSSPTAFGGLVALGKGSFQALGTIKADLVLLRNFTTSVTFAKAVAVTTTGSNIGIGVNVTAVGAAPITFSDSITNLGDPTSSKAQITLSAEGGAINVAGAITGLDFVEIYTDTGDIILSGSVTTSGTKHGTSGYVGGDISIASSTSGNILLSGNISTTGTGDILLGADALGVPSPGTGNLTINGTVSSNAGAILIGAGGGSTVSVNKALTTTGTVNGNVVIYAKGTQTNTINFSKDATITSAAEVIFKILNPVNTVSFASGANISAADRITDGGTGSGNLTLANNLTTTNGLISFDTVSVNLTGPVSIKAGGQAGNINLGNINGAQSLTLEATGNIVATSSTAIGGLTPLNSLTVVNSANSVFLDLNSASVTITDTTNCIYFNGNTVISKNLTTTTEGYDVRFASSKTAVISGAPVFLNTGSISFFGTTSLPGGATVTGGPSTNANLAGTIVSGGAFNIGSGISVINISTNTQLILNSTSAGSTFASPMNINFASAGTFKLLGVGTLTLSADSTTGAASNDTIEVINGTLNVTGKIASTVTSTNGTITGAGGTIGALTVNTGTVAPGGTLNTGAITLNAATNYNAAILTNATASNLKTSSAINLNGANLALSSIPTGLIVGNVFTIIDNTATQTGINGTFAGLPEGATVSAKDSSGNTVAFTISYKGGTGANDVTLTVASITPSQTATPQPMVAGQPVLNKFTAVGADAGGGPLVTITFANGTYTSFFAYDPAFRGGVRVALGDVNADGTPEVITGAGPGGGPQVNVYSVNPQTGAVSFQSSFFAFSAPSFTGGVYVAAGQTNGDSFADVIVGAGATGGSRVQVYAGSATGVVSSSTLNDFFAYSPAFTGGVVVAAGDRNADGDDEVITAPASNGGYNIKSFNVNGTGNNPTLVDNFFAFNNTTSVGGLSLAVGYFNTGAIADLVIGTTNGAFGVIIDSNTSGIVDVPFEGFTGAIRAGVAESSSGLDYAVALAGPTGGPLVSVFAVFSNLRCVDYLFVMNPSFTGGLFGTPTLPRNFR